MLERHQNKHKRRRYSTSSVGVLSLLDARVDGCQVVPESSSGELALGITQVSSICLRVKISI